MKSLTALPSTATSKIPLFLAPAFAGSRAASLNIRSFTSTTCKNERRKRRDMNRSRGVSAMRSTGARRPLTVDKLYPKLPVPREEKERPIEEFPINPNHGLYGFFNKEKKVVMKDEEESQHGRAWAYKELMFKSFPDLHQLYWHCIREANMIATRYGEMKRLKLGYGTVENQTRAKQVKRTMFNIRAVLRDRQLAFDEARMLMNHNKLEELLGDKEELVESNVYDEPLSDTLEAETASESPTISPDSLPSEAVPLRERVIGPRPTK